MFWIELKTSGVPGDDNAPMHLEDLIVFLHEHKFQATIFD